MSHGQGRNILACQMLQKEASNQSSELREEGLRRGPFLLGKWRFIGPHGRTGANQVLISVDVIDPSNGRPEFALWFHKGLQRKRWKFWDVPSLPLRRKEAIAIDGPTAQGTTGLTSAKIHIFLNFNVGILPLGLDVLSTEESQRKGRGWRDGLLVRSNDCS